jgi:hypothetical protein
MLLRRRRAPRSVPVTTISTRGLPYREQPSRGSGYGCGFGGSNFARYIAYRGLSGDANGYGRVPKVDSERAGVVFDEVKDHITPIWE